MIRIIAGVPGSGKSYFMVNFLKKFFNYDSFYEEFSIKENYLIISNIDGLRIPHLKLDSPELIGNPDEGLVGKYTREQFFTVANFEKLMLIKRVSNVLLLIDEAQKDWLFPLGYKDPDVLFFFQYHRHIGVDIVLGTQNVSQIARGILVLAEFIAQATPRSKSVIGNFSYKFTDLKGHFLYSKVLRKDKEVFRAYKSMSVDEIEKPKNVLLHWVVFGLAFLLVGGICFKTALATIKGKSQKAVSVNSLPPGAKPNHGQFSTSRYAPAPSAVAFQSLTSANNKKQLQQSPSNIASAQPMENTKSEPPADITVTGIFTADKTVHYMLSDGQNVQSKKPLKYGDVVRFKHKTVYL